MLATAEAAKPLPQSDLHALARTGKSWEFLALAAIQPPDPALLLLISASCARLGLATLAREALDALPPDLRASSQGRSLAAAIARLPDDAVQPAERERLICTNLAALATKGINLAPFLDAWREQSANWHVWRATDGSMLRRPHASRLLANVDFRASQEAARNAVARMAPLHEPFGPPLVIEGIDPPWILQEAFRATTRDGGYQPRITIVERDPLSFLHALATTDLTPILAHPRLELHVGDAALEGLDASLASRYAEQLRPLALSWGRGKGTLSPDLRSLLDLHTSRQQEETSRLTAATDAYYASLPADHFPRRLADARAGKPLRVLIPTCRFSTFVKHSSADLAVALRRAGHTAETLIEPRDDSQLSTLAYRQAFDRLKPDLVVLVNYPRACMKDAIPQGVPYVCWIQDAMPHLFDAKVGAAQGPLDFTIGHVFGSLFDDHAYPIERALPLAVVADTAKFHDDPPALPRHQCEIAMVTHHSETPEAMHQRLMSESTIDPGIRAIMERVGAQLPVIVSAALHQPATSAITAMIARVAEEVLGSSAPKKSLDQLARHYAVPLADRIFRHQTLEWAAELCRERGWRLHLYGKGWEKHPTLAPFARGELSHDEDLRTAYRGARVHLHAALCSLVHQRVIECSLSGGFCLGRLSYEALATTHATCSARLVSSTPDEVDIPGQRYGYRVDRHPALRERIELHQRLGLPRGEAMLYMPFARHAAFLRKARLVSDDADPRSLFGDLAETTFWSRETFRERLTRALEDQDWREHQRIAMRARVLGRFTFDVVVDRILSLVASGLSAKAEDAA